MPRRKRGGRRGKNHHKFQKAGKPVEPHSSGSEEPITSLSPSPPPVTNSVVKTTTTAGSENSKVVWSKQSQNNTSLPEPVPSTSSAMVLNSFGGFSNNQSKSSIYIPPPLRKQQFEDNVNRAIEEIFTSQELGFLHLQPPPSLSQPNNQIYGWTPWNSSDFGSDFLKQLKTEKESTTASLPNYFCSSSSSNPTTQCQSRTVDLFNQLEPLHVLVEMTGGGELQQQRSSGSSQSQPSASQLSSPSKDEPCSYSTILKCPGPPGSSPSGATRSGDAPKIHIIPMRQFNFTNVPIQFSIHVENLPKSIVLNPDIFEVVAITPSESQTLVCHIRYGSSKGTFLGCFIAVDEAGNYQIRAAVRLNRFMRKQYAKQGSSKQPDTIVGFGDFGNSVNILVNKNYYRHSLKASSNLFLLDFGTGATDVTNNAWGIACDKQTNQIFYTESSTNCISCVDLSCPNGKMIFRKNQGCRGEYFSGTPTGVCCDEHRRRLIVCERDNHRVSFFAMNTGEYIASFGMFGKYNGMFNSPWDVAISPLGNHIAVTDTANNRIQLFDGNGNFLRKCHHKNPLGISFDAVDGRYIYVTDWSAGTVTEFPLDFQTCRHIVSNEEKLLRFPQGLVADGTGGLLVADTRNKCVRHLASVHADDGTQLLSTMSKVGGKSLKVPVNLALTRNGLVALLEESGKVHLF